MRPSQGASSCQPPTRAAFARVDAMAAMPMLLGKSVGGDGESPAAGVLAEYSIRAISGDATGASCLSRHHWLAGLPEVTATDLPSARVIAAAAGPTEKTRRKDREKVAKTSGKGENGGASGNESVASGGEIGRDMGGFTRLGGEKRRPNSPPLPFNQWVLGSSPSRVTTSSVVTLCAS